MTPERLFQGIDKLVTNISLDALRGVDVTAHLPEEEFTELSDALLVTTVGDVFKESIATFTVSRHGLEVTVVSDHGVEKPAFRMVPR